MIFWSSFHDFALNINGNFRIYTEFDNQYHTLNGWVCVGVGVGMGRGAKLSSVMFIAEIIYFSLPPSDRSIIMGAKLSFVMII